MSYSPMVQTVNDSQSLGNLCKLAVTLEVSSKKNMLQFSDGLIGSNLSQVRFHPAKNILAVSSNQSIEILEVKNDCMSSKRLNMNLLHSIANHFYPINCCCWNEEGTLLATGGNDSMINIYDANNGMSLVRNLMMIDSQSAVTSIDFNYTSNLFISGIYDKQIHIYDIRMSKPAFRIIAHSEPITSVSFSDDSINFLSTSYDGFLRIWDIYKGNCLKTIALEKSPPLGKAEFLPDGNHAVVSSLNSQIQVVDLKSEEEILRFTGHQNTNYLLDFDFATKFTNHSVEAIQTLDRIEGDETLDYNKLSLKRYLSESMTLLAGSEDGNIHVWDFSQPESTCKYNLNNDVSKMGLDAQQDLCVYSLSANFDSSLICVLSEQAPEKMNRNNLLNNQHQQSNTELQIFSLFN